MVRVTESKIERAKRRAVGGKRKRCIKGKSCSATCIASNKICLVDIPWVFQGEISKTRKLISKTIKPPTIRLSEKEIQDAVMLAKYHAKAYEDVAKKKNQTPQTKEALAYHKLKAEEALKKLPEGELKSKTKDFVDEKLGIDNVNNNRKNFEKAVSDAKFWLKAGDSRGDDYEKQARSLINKLPEQERVAALRKLNEELSAVRKEYADKKAKSQAEKERLRQQGPRIVLRQIRNNIVEMEKEFDRAKSLAKEGLDNGASKENAEKAWNKAIMALYNLSPNDQYKARITMERRKVRALNDLLTPKEREKYINDVLLKYKSASVFGRKAEADGLKEQARLLAGGFSGAKRAKIDAKLDKAFGELKPLKFGNTVESADDLAKIGKELTDRYPQLRAARSILNRYERISQVIGERLSSENAYKLSAKERERLSEQWMRADFLKGSAQDKLNKAMEKVREDMLKTSLTKSQIDQALNRIDFIKSPGIKETRNHVVEFIRMFNGRGITDVDFSAGGSPLLKITAKNTRAFARTTSGEVVTNGTKKTTFHEISHLMEAQRSWMFSFASKWRKDRAYSESQAIENGVKATPFAEGQGKAVFRLKELTGNNLYEKNEIALADKYINPYMGKIYTDGKSTEVWSMALEHFSSPELMGRLYLAHPDLFEIGVGLSRS
jgi:hypothetical protein